MSNIKDGIEDINDKMKTAVKAVANKVKDPGIDTGTQYKKEKMNDDSLEESPLGDTATSTSSTSTSTSNKETPKTILSSVPHYKKIWFQMIILSYPINP